MLGVITTVYVDRVEVDIIDNRVRGSVIHQLLAGARAVGEQIHIDTGGRFPIYWVSLAAAEQSGILSPLGPPAAPTIAEPPRTGKGSSRDAWLEFLGTTGIEVPDLGATRDQLFAIWDSHKGTS